MKREDVSSTRNALRVAQQAEETGRATLERLGAQGERIHNTERNLDMASSQNRLAEDKARELKHLNRSMWAMQVNNPFTKGRNERRRDEDIMNTHHAERERRDATRAAAFGAQSRAAETQRDLKGSAAGEAKKRGNLAERSKYQFEADSEDEAMEDEIDGNLEDLHKAVGGLNRLGKAMGREVDEQNKVIEVVTGKVSVILCFLVMMTAMMLMRVTDRSSGRPDCDEPRAYRPDSLSPNGRTQTACIEMNITIVGVHIHCENLTCVVRHIKHESSFHPPRMLPIQLLCRNSFRRASSA